MIIPSQKISPACEKQLCIGRSRPSWIQNCRFLSQVYGLMEYTLSEMSVRFAGDSFIYEDPDATYPFGFMQVREKIVCDMID